MSHLRVEGGVRTEGPRSRAAVRRASRKSVAASGIPASETIYLGDEVRDAEAAHKAGMAYGAVGWGYHSLATLRAAGAAEFFDTPAEIGTKLTGAPA